MILIAEDHPDTAVFLKRALERKGYQAEIAEDGAEALKVLEKVTPQLLILDLMMPRISGLQLLELMQGNAQWKQIPVVIYSAGFEQRQQQAAMDLGAKAYLVKGAVDLNGIFAAVEEHSSTRRAG
jgi:DNA-binding response OmpR family regulator